VTAPAFALCATAGKLPSRFLRYGGQAGAKIFRKLVLMIPKHRMPTHPGEMLLEEFLKPMQLTQVEVAAKWGSRSTA